MNEDINNLEELGDDSDISLGQMLNKKLGLEVDPMIFWISAAISIVFVGLCLTCTDVFIGSLKNLQQAIADKAGWVYILIVNILVLFLVYLYFSKYSNITLGGDNADPEFSDLAWIAMLYSAGLGIALVFYGSYEPLIHYASPPLGEAETIESAKMAMALTFFHWGIHPWAIYGTISLAIAFFFFNKGLPLSIHSLFYPIFGRRIFGVPGKIIDTFAVLAAIFGIIVSFALGAKQVTTGLHLIFPSIPENNITLLIVTIFVATAALVSVVLGLKRGVQKLSELNIGLALLVLLFVFITGPTLFLANSILQNIGFYLQRLIDLSTWNAAYQSSHEWQHNWTIFYWSWWIAWAPMVGIFIARISKGRTVKEFIQYVILVPSLATFVWFTVFGNTALYEELFGNGGLLQIAMSNESMVTFALLKKLPFSFWSSLMLMLVIIIFFVTSLDSGTLVVDSITSGGQKTSPLKQKVFWLIIQAVMAYVLLIGGGIESLKTVVILASFPTAIALLFVCYAFMKALDKEYKRKKKKLRYLKQKLLNKSSISNSRGYFVS